MATSPDFSRVALSVLRLGRACGANALMKGVLRLAPGLDTRIRSMIRSWRARGGYGRSLVPVEALHRSYREALRLLNEPGLEPIGDYLEFGVCHGTSLLCMYRALLIEGPASMRLFGFDSFEGLPDSAATDDEGTWHPGQFDSDEATTRRILTREGVEWDRVELVRGWYDEVLDDCLIARYDMERAAIIMIDCDMYLSAITALRFCGPLIGDRAIIYFDDWHEDLAERNLGERRAFEEFLQEHPELTARDVPELRYHKGSRVYVVTRVHSEHAHSGSAPMPVGTGEL